MASFQPSHIQPCRTSVVICAYTEERWDDLVAAVEATAAQDPAPDEILVVVDHAPGLEERLDRAGLPVRILANDAPRGLSGARNTGVAAATGDIVVFLDDDASPRAGWLAALLDAYGPDVIAVGGAAVPAWADGRPAWFPVEFDWVVGCTYRGSPTTRSDVRNLIGSNMSFRRSALLAAGPFDRRLGRIGKRPVGAEETELCLRAVRVHPGSRIVLEPAAVVDHRVPRSRARLSYFLARCWGEGRSKAVLATLDGSDRALATERAYVRAVLPRAVARGLGDLLRGDPDGARRATAVVLGLVATTAGYALGRVEQAMARPTSIGATTA